MRSSRKLFYSTEIRMIITGNIINGRCRYAPEEKLQLESYVIQKGK
jgi:hypothetical protein